MGGKDSENRIWVLGVGGWGFTIYDLGFTI